MLALRKKTEKGKTAELAAKLVGSSYGSVERASKVLRDGSPELIKAIENSEIGLQPAANISKLPKEQQLEALKEALAKKSEPKPKKKTVEQQNAEYAKV